LTARAPHTADTDTAGSALRPTEVRVAVLVSLLCLSACSGDPGTAPVVSIPQATETRAPPAAAIGLALSPDGEHTVLEATWPAGDPEIEAMKLPSALGTRLVRRRADGTVRWRQELGDEMVWAIASTADGGVWAVGHPLSTRGFIAPNQPSSLRYFHANGDAGPRHSLGDDGAAMAVAVAVGPDGSTWGVGGRMAGTQPTAGRLDALVGRVGADAAQHTQALGGAEVDLALAVAPTASGGAWIAGITDSPTFPHTTAPRLGGWDGFVAHVDRDGVAQNAARLGGSGDDFIYSAVANPDGSVTVAGWSSSPELFEAPLPQGASGLFVLRHDPAATPPDRVLLSGCCSSYDQHVQLEVDPGGGLVLASGYAGGAFTLAGSKVTSEAAVGGFMARLDDDGTLRSIDNLGPMLHEAKDLPIGLTVAADGRACVAHSRVEPSQGTGELGPGQEADRPRPALTCRPRRTP
jgi:hypothetical protein